MSVHRVTLEPAIILHTRPYSNSSLIIELFSRTHGRVPALARSARGPQSRYRGELQLFVPLLVSWSGRHELKSLTQAERQGMAYQLQGQALLSGFYINELLLRLLQREDPHPQLFDDYVQTLRNLQQPSALLPTLRVFEKQLLEGIGYGLPLNREARHGEPVVPDQYYQYVPDYGFVRCESAEGMANVFQGRCLLALYQEQMDDAQVLQESKRLMRLALAKHLGAKPLKSRELMT